MKCLKSLLSQILIVCFCSLILSGFSIGQDSTVEYSDQQITGNLVWQSVSEIGRAMSDHHVSPPTRQQMYLGATQALLQDNFSERRKLVGIFSGLSDEEDFQKHFLKTWKLAEESESFDPAAAFTAATNGTLHSGGVFMGRYISPKAFRVAHSLKENQYVGIGIQLALRDDLPVITKPFYGGAAQKSGARVNDIIIEVDGQTTEGRTLGDVVDQLRGPKDSEVKVKLRNADDGDTREYVMVRNTIPLPTVEGTERKDDGTWLLSITGQPADVAYLNFSSIVGSTAAELQQLGLQMKQEGFRSAILNFRNVGLSDIHHVTMLADALLDQQVLGYVQEGDVVSELTSRPGNALGDIPVAVIPPMEMDGPLLLLLSNLKNRPNTKFVGTIARSHGLATKLYELPNGLGAIENFPCAHCKPEQLQKTQDLEMVNEAISIGHMIGRSLYSIQPDVATAEDGVELAKRAVEAIKEIQSQQESKVSQ